MTDYPGYHGDHQPPGFVTAAESNEIGLKKARKSARVTTCLEGRQSVLCPPFMDDRRIAAKMDEGLTREEAEEALRREWLLGDGVEAANHTCHWPGCRKEVPPKLWGCRRHWFRLPKPLRDRIWATYRPGQEITKTPSAEYLTAAHEVREWIVSTYVEPYPGAYS